LQSVIAEIEALPEYRFYGRVAAIQGMLVEVAGIERRLSIGSRVHVEVRHNEDLPCEVVGFQGGRALLLPYGSLEGVGIGCKAKLAEQDPVIFPDASWLGRVVDAMGRPVDGGPPLSRGPIAHPLRTSPPPAHARNRVGGKIDLGVRSLNTFLTCCRGQRMGIFAGSGVGKSVLLSMLARYTASDVNVIGLVGERGREVQEFIEDYLGPEGMARTVVVVATSDESPLMRRQAAHLTMTVAEFFRDTGKDVLCMIDSVTRFAMAQREIGLSGGEPPASKGYTPTVFAELPKLLERAGPGVGKGSITGLFTVLVEGDDHNEPIADAARGILDGHIVLDRSIAERGRFPAVNILRSISRTMPGCNSDGENAVVARAKRLMAVFDDVAEMVRLGAYQRGSDALVDESVHFHEPLEAFLAQDKEERVDLESGYAQLAEILGISLSEGPDARESEAENVDPASAMGAKVA
jgi:flagellum-specific ATP synthase